VRVQLGVIGPIGLRLTLYIAVPEQNGEDVVNVM
jgi:hypothetical protein